MLYSQRGNRLLWLLCIASLLVALKLTGSKANLLIMAVFIPSLLIVFAYVTYDGIKRFWMILLTILGCVVLGALVIYLLSILNPRAFHLLEDVIVDGEATNSLHARARVWEQSIQSLKDNPLLGVGAGQPILTLSHSHNLALDFARTLGAPGLVFIMTKVAIILAICASTVLYAIGQKAAPLGDRRLCIGLMFAPVAYLGANFSSDSLGPTTSPYLYGVLFLGLASRSLLKPDPLRFRSRAVVR
jgi:O-antigen ligase